MDTNAEIKTLEILAKTFETALRWRKYEQKDRNADLLLHEAVLQASRDAGNIYDETAEMIIIEARAAFREM